jgi:ABC-type amino acid transport substrate-binding protein
MKREFAVLGLIISFVVGGLMGWLIPAYIINIPRETLYDRIQSRGTLIIGTSSDWPPFEIYNITTEELKGFDIDLCNLIADYLNVSIEWRDMEFAGLTASLDSGLIDLIAAAMFITPDRLEKYAASVPYIRTNEVVIALDNSTAIVNTVEDVANYSVGVQTGTAEMYELDDLSIPYDDYPNAYVVINSLVSEINDVAFVDEPVFTVWSKTYNLKTLFTVPAEPTALFTRQGEPEFLGVVNKVIVEAFKDGTMDVLINKWFT